MAGPPAKKVKVNSAGSSGDTSASQAKEECTMISMVVGKGRCLSPVYRIGGYPWRVRLCKMQESSSLSQSMFNVFVRCEKSMDAELWRCTAAVHLKERNEDHPGHTKIDLVFSSADKNSQELLILKNYWINEGSQLDVYIKPADNGDKWRHRPILSPLDPRDGCFVIEDKKVYVNKQSLASQSPYFERLFNSSFKEKNMTEIPLGDVSAEEFTNLMRMLYGENGDSVVAEILTHDNICRILDLADRFGLKIIDEGVANFLLSADSSFSIHEKLFIADKHHLNKCKDRIIETYKDTDLDELRKGPEYVHLSVETMKILFNKCCDALAKSNEQIPTSIKKKRR